MTGLLIIWHYILTILSWVVMMARKHWRIALVVVGLVFLLSTVILLKKSCSNRKVKIDESTIQKINSENRAERIKELTEVVESNADVIKTVDERTELVEVNAIERNAEVDRKVRDADLKIQEAKAQGKDITGPELECILLPEKCQ
jgi:ABC-type multidrug transport system fused ATPase/permease subunit